MKVFAHKRGRTACQDRRGKHAYRQQFHGVFSVLIALAFAAQGFVAQTHIHGITQKALTELSLGKADLGQADWGKAGLGHAKGKLPSLPGEKDCPLCRLAAFVGSCVVPLVVLALPAAISALLPVPEPVPFTHVDTSSHSWQVRAPPR